jgi:aldehyde dehydrogenase (NAD+)
MQEELFGPLLPLIEIRDLEDALARLHPRARPLAIYLFSEDSGAQERLLAASSSGSVAFNDVVIQAGMAGLPFGGVGESGMGRYHGEAGLLTFSQQRTLLRRPLWPDVMLRYPPYKGRLPWLRRLLG